MRKTKVTEKLVASIISVLVSLVIWLPLSLIPFLIPYRKILLIGVFFLYNLIFLLFNNFRDIGMVIVGSYWERDYAWFRKLIYITLYTLSFSTLIYWVYFPFDLLLTNLLLIQLSSVLITGTTLHGYLSGNLVTIMKKRKMIA